MAWWQPRDRREASPQPPDAVDATASLEEALRAAQARHGHDHPVTLAARTTVAADLLAADRVQEAEALLEWTVAGCRGTLGADHPDTLVARGNLAVARFRLGLFVDGLAELVGVLADRTRVLGEEHPATLAAWEALATAQRLDGNLAAALPLAVQVAARRTRVLGPAHPDTLTSRTGLALTRADCGDSGLAVEGLRQTLRDAEAAHGVDALACTVVRAALGEALARAGRTTEAVATLERARAGCARELGSDHPDTVVLGEELARLLDDHPPAATPRAAAR